MLSTGIGFQAAKRLVIDYGWEVVLACRTKDKALRAMESINEQVEKSKGDGNATVLEYPLDLSDFSSVTKYAQAIRKRYPKIDVLINNAGINSSGKSNDNLDLLFQSNFLGHFLLTNLLIDNLKSDESVDCERGGRIINLSSVMHHFSGHTPKDSTFWKSMAAYNDPTNDDQQQQPESNYAASKLAMILFSQELNRRYGESCRIKSIAVNPGSVASDIWRSYPSFLQAAFRCVYLSPVQGCIPVVAAAVIDDVLVNHGNRHTHYFQPYYIPSRHKNRPMIPWTEMLGPYIGYVLTTPRMPPNGGRKEAVALWSASEELTRCS